SPRLTVLPAARYNRRGDPGSFNGRTAAFGAAYRGSNPCPGVPVFVPSSMSRFVSPWLDSSHLTENGAEGESRPELQPLTLPTRVASPCRPSLRQAWLIEIRTDWPAPRPGLGPPLSTNSGGEGPETIPCA